MTTRRLAKRLRVLAVAAIAALMALTACGSNSVSDDGTITLRLAHYMPTTHQIATDGIEVWMEEVTKRTQGKVEFDYYPAGQLISAEEMFSAVRSGAVDIGAFVPANAAAADLPLSEVPTVPGFRASSAQVVQAAYWNLLKGPLGDGEWKEAGVRPLMGVVTGLYQFVMTDSPRRTLGDWRGRTVRSPGGVVDFLIQGLDAASVTIPGPEEYEALQRGTVDSAINTVESIPVYDFNEVLGAATLNAPIGASLVVMGINQNTWDSLPQDVQAAMQQASEIAQTAVAKRLARQRIDAVEETKGDLDYYELNSSTLDELQPILENVQRSWTGQRSDGGREILDDWVAALAKAEVEAKAAQP
jgi:TRAP-type transport system periplasmic protein